MSDQFVRVTEQSWGSRLGASIKGILFGGLLVLAGPALLFWNEGRAVHRAQALAEGAGSVVEARADAVDPALEARLVHVSATATTTETLRDPLFGVARNALSLERKVAMYQWKEHEERHSRKKLGGGTETTTTYTYAKGWSDSPEDSASFRERSGHQNPSFPFRGDSWRAADVRLGAYHLAPELASQLDRQEPVAVAEQDLPAVSDELRPRLRIDDGTFYLGDDPSAPAVGDLRVSFSAVPAAAASVVAAQHAGTLDTYHTRAGGDLALVDYGTVAAAAMFRTAQQQNTALAWALRFVGFLVLFVGIRSILAPLRVFADVVPLFGRIVGAGLGLVSLLVAAPVALVTIAVGWLVFRPVLAVALLAGALAFGAWLLVHLRRPRPAMIPAFVPPPPPPAPAT